MTVRSYVPLTKGDVEGITCIAAPSDYYQQRAHHLGVALWFAWPAVVAAMASAVWLRGRARMIAVAILVVALGCAALFTLTLDEDGFAPLRPCHHVS
jgi:hypothetical protein